MQSRFHQLTTLVAALVIALACGAALAATGATQPKPKAPEAKAEPPKVKPGAPAPKSPVRPTRPSRRPSRWRSRGPLKHSKNHVETRTAFKAVAAEANASTVAIFDGEKQVALGAVVDATGYVLTKASELPPAPLCRFHDNRASPATVVARDDRNDLALLKVPLKGLKPVRWAGGDALPVGSWIVTPGPSDVPISIGVVSVAERKGPSGRQPARGFLGISFPQTGSDARIGKVIPRSGAAQAGLKANDVITKVDNKPVTDREALLRILRWTKPDQKIKLRVERNGKVLDVPATLGPYPPAGLMSPQQTMGGAVSDRRTGFESIIQHDSTLQPHQCGGPALNADGEAVGINISRAGRVESYILPADLVQTAIARLMTMQVKTPKKPAPTGKTPK